MKNYLVLFLVFLLGSFSVVFAEIGIGVSQSGFLTSLPPAMPELNAPADSSGNVAVDVKLIWLSLIHAATYNLQVADTSDFSNLVIDQTGLTDTSFSATGLDNSTTYFWRVSAVNVAGTGDFSSTRQFTTIVAAPGAPTLASPDSGAVNIQIDAELVWHTVPTAVTYHIQVSNLPDFSNLIVNQAELADTSFAVTGFDNNTTYHWRVSADNIAGTGEFSTTWSFTTIMASPDIPVLAEPVNGAMNVPVNTKLKWHSVATAENYHLQVSTLTDFSNLVVDQADLGDTSFAVSGLENNITYHWRLSADNIGGTGEYSQSWSFTTIVALPEAPVLSEPGDGAIDVPIETELKWHAINVAETYHLQISTSQDFSNLLIDETDLADSSFFANGLENNTTYHWRVNAENAAGSSEYSDTWSFTTVALSAVDQDNLEIPKAFALLPIYPNPFNPVTTITYDLSKEAVVSVIVYNSMGQMVRVLTSGRHGAGRFTVKWRATDSRDVAVTSGLYICRFEVEGHVFSKKMLLMR